MVGAALSEMPWTFAVVFIAIAVLIVAFAAAAWLGSHHS